MIERREASMHQVVLRRGTAPDYGTFIYPLKVPHTHPHMSKTVGSHQTWFLQLIRFSVVRSIGRRDDREAR